jgi:hypothetical protein
MARTHKALPLKFSLSSKGHAAFAMPHLRSEAQGLPEETKEKINLPEIQKQLHPK